MRLEEMNARKKDGATMEQIGRLPIIPVRHVPCVAVHLVMLRDERVTDWCRSLALSSESMLRSPEASTCAVCLSDFDLNTPVRMMRCFHHFHPDCIDRWLRSKAECPICKFPAFEGS